MKGTIARGVTPAADAANYERLRNSAKDQAENVMIVDLLRNDIARIAQTDTLKCIIYLLLKCIIQYIK